MATDCPEAGEVITCLGLWLANRRTDRDSLAGLRARRTNELICIQFVWRISGSRVSVLPP